jgi:hypothetical protein
MKGGQSAKPKLIEECDCDKRFPYTATYHYMSAGVVKSYAIESIKQLPTLRRTASGGYEIKLPHGKEFFPLINENGKV